MNIKVALILLIIQAASSSSRAVDQETSEEVSSEDKSQEPRIADLLSILNDESEGDDQTKLVHILPISSEERYQKHEKKWNERKRLLRKNKKPLAIILTASDLKRNKYSRILEDLVRDPKKDERKDLKEVKKESLLSKSNEILSKELSTEDLSKVLSKEDLSSGLSKQDLPKDLSKEDLLPKQLSNEDFLKELSDQDLSKEFSKHDLSNESSKEFFSKRDSYDISMEEVSTGGSKENSRKGSEKEGSFEEIDANIVSTEENVSKEKPIIIASRKHTEDDNKEILSEENQTHEQHNEKNSDSFPVASDSSQETSPEKDASSKNKEIQLFTADEKSKINSHDVIEYTELVSGKVKDESPENEAKKVSQTETEKFAQSDKEIFLEASFDLNNNSKGIVTDTWKNIVKSKGGVESHKSYNLSFLFNKK